MNSRFLPLLQAGVLTALLTAGAFGQAAPGPDAPLVWPDDSPVLTGVCSACELPSCDCGVAGSAFGAAGRYVVGADFLLIRPSFSEAIAFCRGVQTPISLRTEEEPLAFDYEPAFRIHAGYRLGNGGSEFAFDYTRIAADVRVSGGVNAPGEFIVDPFGAVVGQVTIIDPSNALFGQTLPGALGLPVSDRIDTMAEVELNIWDMELRRAVPLQDANWGMQWSAGVRAAEIDQYYESRVTAAGATIAFGDYTVDYVGAGPRMGLNLERRGLAWAVFASGHGSLLLGEYDVDFSAMPAPGFTAGQSQSMTRMVPVTELEVGGRFSPMPGVNLSAGWLFHSWFDLGTSGGKFGGLFTGQEDANIMSFDGLFLRGELAY